MKKKILTAALLVGFLTMGANAIYEPFAPVAGEMNVFTVSLGGPGDYSFFSNWGVADVQALTTDDITFELLPNINAYNAADPFWSDGAGDGNAWLEATTLFRKNPIAANMTNATFNFTVDANDLDARYSVVAFVRVRQVTGDWSVVTEDTVTLGATGTESLSIPIVPGYAGLTCDAGFTMFGINANPADDWGSVTVSISELSIAAVDNTPPTPATMTFASAPATLSDDKITMTAATATDALGDVQYFFDCTTDGAFDSAWQSSETYVASGLAASTLYSFTVTARDTPNGNENNVSLAASATTVSTDTAAPLPSPMTFAGADPSPVSVKLTATTASDASAVEYFFANTTITNHDSGWQSSPVYVDFGLASSSNYSYTVTARDLAAAVNTTAPGAITITTDAEPASGSLTNALTGYANNTSDDVFKHDLALVGLTTGSINSDAIIAFDGSGATFGDGIGYSARDLLKTTAAGYENVSFVAYATLTFAGQNDLSGFIGMGQGIQTGIPDNYSVPELNLNGVNGVVAQFKDSTAGDVPAKCQLFKFVEGAGEATANFIVGGENIVGPVIGSTETIRARLTYDADAATVNVSYDSAYAGGAFVADVNMGTVSTSVTDTNSVTFSMWTNAPVRVYFGGGEGTIVKDIEITASTAAVVIAPTDLVIVTGSGSVTISWTGVSGQIYNIEYKNDLEAVTWTADASAGTDIAGTAGTMSTTSTAPGTEVFYQVITE